MAGKLNWPKSNDGFGKYHILLVIRHIWLKSFPWEGWEIGNQDKAQQELLGLISSRMKTSKKNGSIRENSKPVVSSALVDKVETFYKEEDLAKARFFSKCWTL